MINNVDYFSHKTSGNRVARGLKLLPTICSYHTEPVGNKHNLDYGGGKFDSGTKYLANYGIINHVYDPFNRTPEHNAKALNHEFDSVTLLNVLNVIASREERIQVIRDAYSRVKPGGVFIVQIYEGNCSGVGVIGKTKTYQHNHKMGLYVHEICDGVGTQRIYLRTEITQKSFIITKPNETV